MKLQLDTTAKTIKVEESVNLGELTDFFNKILPNNLWREFKLETNVTINWNTTPIIVRELYPPYTMPWWQQYPIACASGDCYDNTKPVLCSGVYNIEN